MHALCQPLSVRGDNRPNVVILDAAEASEAPVGYAPGNLGQCSGSTVFNWVARRGPRRIDPYLAGAASQGLVRVLTVAQGAGCLR
jgi:hypothetical protein